MKIQRRDLDLGVSIFEIFLTDDYLDQAFNKAVEYWRKNAHIPGYRVGKAPVELVMKNYSDKIQEKFLENVSEMLYEIIAKEAGQKINSFKVIRRKVEKSESKFEIPGEMSSDEYNVFTVKVSFNSRVIVDDENKLRDVISNISYENIVIDEESIDWKDLKSKIFANTIPVKQIKDDVYKDYIVSFYILSSKLESPIPVSIFLSEFPELKRDFNGRKLLEIFELSIPKSLLDVIYADLEGVVIDSKAVISISKIVEFSSSEDIIKSKEEKFKKMHNQTDLTGEIVNYLKKHIHKFNIERFKDILIRQILKNFKISVGENDYKETLLDTIYEAIDVSSYYPVHIFLGMENLNSYKDITYMRLTRKIVMDTLFDILVGGEKTKNFEDMVLDKASSIAKISTKSIKYQDFKRTYASFFLDFVFLLDFSLATNMEVL